MRCLTCGKRIRPPMKECPNCGAMIPRPEQGAPQSAGNAADWKSVLTSRPAPPATFGGQPAPSDNMPPMQPDGELAEEGAEQQERPAAPPAPAWTQYIVPTIITLWVAFRMFGPNIERFIAGKPWEEEPAPAETSPVGAAAAPELLRLQLCDRVEANAPVNLRNRFSRSQDRVVTIFTRWSGEPAARRFQFNWRSPAGKALTGKQRIVRLPTTPTSFILVGELPLGGFTEIGQWDVAVMLDDSAVASYEYAVDQ